MHKLGEIWHFLLRMMLNIRPQARNQPSDTGGRFPKILDLYQRLSRGKLDF